MADMAKGSVAFSLCCVRRDGVVVSEDELKRFALDHAPAYMHPRLLRFLDRLPSTTTGRIDRKLLQQRAVASSLSSTAR